MLHFISETLALRETQHIWKFWKHFSFMPLSLSLTVNNIMNAGKRQTLQKCFAWACKLSWGVPTDFVKDYILCNKFECVLSFTCLPPVSLVSLHNASITLSMDHDNFLRQRFISTKPRTVIWWRKPEKTLELQRTRSVNKVGRNSCFIRHFFLKK